jgi:uncharacterized protein (TIGR03437 family)
VLIRICLALAAWASTASAQGPFVGQLPDAEAGVPYEYSLLPDLNDIPFIKDLLTNYNATFTGTGSGDVPGLTITGGTRVGGVPTRAGAYQIQLVLLFTYVADRETRTFRGVFNSGLVVRGPTSTGLAIEGGIRSFDFTEGDTIPQTRAIRVTNRGQLTRVVSATVTSQPRGWLTAGATTSVAPFSTAAIPVTANPAGLRAGVYTGSIELTASGGTTERFTVPVILTVVAAGPAISVSQTGLTFEVQQGSTARLSQSFQVTGSSRTPIAFSNIVSVLGAGSWLRVSPAEGNAGTATAPTNVTASIVPDGLNPGAYYGQIEVRAAAASNSPRTVNVVLNVLPAATTVTPLVTPSAVVLVQRPGVPVASQTVAVTNVTRSTIPLSVGVAFEGNNAGWMAAGVSASSARPGETANIVVSRATSVRLSPGVYRAEMVVSLGDTQRRVAVVLVIPQAPGNTAASDFRAGDSPRLDGCTPAKLLPVFQTLGSAFSVVVGWPTALEMLVVDDCGEPFVAGLTVVSFSDGSPPLVMSTTGAGGWSGTWQPKRAVANLVLTATATSAGTATQLTGAAQIGGATTANPSAPPSIDTGGVVSAAASLPGSPLAPGGFISIYGSAMANGLNVAQTLPFPIDLAGTQALLGGKRLPMHFTASGQVNAILPYDVPFNTPQLMLVRRGNTLSTPEQVVVAQAQPAVFATQTNEGRVTLVDGSVVSATNPATAGGALIIYCAGLGAVSESIAAGSAAPTDRLVTTTNPVTVTVGGRSAQVLFAGLTPGLAGLYQVNVIVPEGVTPGPVVDLVLTVAGRSSSPVTVAIK